MMKVSQMIQKIDEGRAKLSKGQGIPSRIYINLVVCFISYLVDFKASGKYKIHAPRMQLVRLNVQSTVYVILEDVIVTKVTRYLMFNHVT